MDDNPYNPVGRLVVGLIVLLSLLASLAFYLDWTMPHAALTQRQAQMLRPQADAFARADAAYNGVLKHLCEKVGDRRENCPDQLKTQVMAVKLAPVTKVLQAQPVAQVKTLPSTQAKPPVCKKERKKRTPRRRQEKS